MPEETPLTVPAPEPPPEPAKSSNGRQTVMGAFIVVAAMIIILMLGVIFWPQFYSLVQPKGTPVAAVPAPPIPTPNATTGTATSTNTATSTPENANCIAPDGAPGFFVGERVTLFEDDTRTMCERDGARRMLQVTASAFGDSRCPANVQCIWAGERTVTLDALIPGSSEPQQTIMLGTTRALQGTLFGHQVTLHLIEDGKGGTYAEVTFE